MYVMVTLSDGTEYATGLVDYVLLPLDVLAGSHARVIGRRDFLRYRRERVQ